MKVNHILEMSPILAAYGSRNLRQRAQDWIDTNTSYIGTVAHLWDEGNEEAVREYLSGVIQDEKLLHAVIGVMFNH